MRTVTKRQVFFSFHYDADSWRASQIRNMGVIARDSTFSDNDWEEVKTKDDDSIKKWIDEQLQKRSCTIVLVGAETANRKWINYEIKRSLELNKGIFGICIHKLKNQNEEQTNKGEDPFNYIFYSEFGGFYSPDNWGGKILNYFNVGIKMSMKIKCHNTRFNDSQKVYSFIEKNIQTWIEDAIDLADHGYDL